MTDLGLTAANMADVVEKYTGNTSAGSGISYVNTGYRRFLNGFDSRTGQAHVWSFLRPAAQIDIGGSANSVSSLSGNYVISSGTIFNHSMVGLTITIMSADSTSDSELNITKYLSGNTVVVDSSVAWTRGSCTCSVESDGITDLPADFDGVIDGFVYPYSEDSTAATPDMQETSVESVMRAWRNSDETDDPRVFAITPVTLTASAGQRYQLYVAPRPSEARTLQYRYLAKVDVLTDTANYAVGGPRHAETIKYAALAAAEIEVGRVDTGPMERRYLELMAGSIDNDTNLFGTIEVEQMKSDGID